MANSVHPDWSTLFASILNSSVKLGNYLQQMTFSDAFFLGALRVKYCNINEMCNNGEYGSYFLNMKFQKKSKCSSEIYDKVGRAP